MSNVINIRAARRLKGKEAPETQNSGDFSPTGTATVTPLRVDWQSVEQITWAGELDSLATGLDQYRLTLLELAQERREEELRQMVATETAKLQLEVAAYRAMLAGVPEDEIYGLGEDMAEALESAMKTVAGE